MAGDSFEIGDIVEVTDKNNAEFGLRGVVREVGPTVVIAVTYLSNLKPKQIKKVDVLSKLTWNELRTKAKEVGVRAVGPRDELEASVAAAAPLASSREMEAETDFPVDAIVQISDPDDKLRDKCRGKVIEGPSVTVQLTNVNFDVEVKRYPKSKLTRVG